MHNITALIILVLQQITVQNMFPLSEAKDRYFVRMGLLLLLNLLQTLIRSRLLLCRLVGAPTTTIVDYNAFQNPDNFRHTAQDARCRWGAAKKTRCR